MAVTVVSIAINITHTQLVIVMQTPAFTSLRLEQAPSTTMFCDFLPCFCIIIQPKSKINNGASVQKSLASNSLRDFFWRRVIDHKIIIQISQFAHRLQSLGNTLRVCCQAVRRCLYFRCRCFYQKTKSKLVTFPMENVI